MSATITTRVLVGADQDGNWYAVPEQPDIYSEGPIVGFDTAFIEEMIYGYREANDQEGSAHIAWTIVTTPVPIGRLEVNDRVGLPEEVKGKG